MFLPLLVLSSYLLLLIGPARAQINAPDCTEYSIYSWVSSHCAHARFMLITSHFRCLLDLSYIVVQFASTKSLLGCCVPASVVQRQRSVYALLVHRVRSYWRFVGFAFSIPALPPQNHYTGPSGSDDDDLCKCNTVVYNLMSACDACQGSSWILCVDQLYFRLHPIQTTDL